MRHSIHSEIDIEAPPWAVWGALTDLSNYRNWNPFISSAQGNVVVGARLTNRLQPPGRKAMTFRPTVTAVEPDHLFEWLGHLGVPGIFDGRHRFELTSTNCGGTHLVHSEEFNGILVRFLRKTLNTHTLQGFKAMNAALKTQAESHARASS